jgi:hypothetical protein
MHRHKLPVLILITGGALVSCGRSPAQQTRPTPAAVAPAASPTPQPPPVDPALARLPLGQRLASEASSRPPTALRAEDLPPALRSRGIAVAGWQQVLGSTIGARYCMAGQTTAGLALALCEFSDAGSAERGLAYSRATFDHLIPNRALRRKGNTVITIAPPEATPALAAQARQVTEVFAAL